MVRTPELRVSMTWPQFLRQECTVARQQVKLSPFEARVLLAFMLSNPARPLTLPELIERIWDIEEPELENGEQAIRKAIERLRSKRIKVESCGHSWGYHLPVRRRAPDRLYCLNPRACKAKTEHHCDYCAKVAKGKTQLTQKQACLLELIRTSPPMTQNTMQRLLGYKSKSAIQGLLERLECKGLIRTTHSKFRSARVVNGGPKLFTCGHS